jgi:hypothetical protein
VTTGANN